MLAKPIAACTHLSSTVSQLFEPQVLSFYVLYYCIIIQCSSYLATWLPFLINRLDWIGSAKKSPISRTAAHVFVSPGDAPAIITQYGWKENSMLAKRLAACTYLSLIVSELYDAQVNA